MDDNWDQRPKNPTNLIIMIQTLDVFLKIMSVIFFDEITLYIYAECHILKLNTNTTLISKHCFLTISYFLCATGIMSKGNSKFLVKYNHTLNWLFPRWGGFCLLMENFQRWWLMVLSVKKNLRDKIIPKVMVFATFCVFFCLQKQAPQPAVPISTPL